MKAILILIVLLIPSILIANPVVTKNVHVIQNATAAQCTSSWRGSAASETNVLLTGAGQSNSVATPAIQSCTGCVLEDKTHDCVCATCYAYTN